MHIKQLWQDDIMVSLDSDSHVLNQEMTGIIYTFIQASYIPVLLFFRGGKVNVNLICMIELFLEDKFGYRFI